MAGENIITETDGDNGQTQVVESLSPGPLPPPIQPGAGRAVAPPPPEYDIVETDEAGTPLVDGRPTQPTQPQPSEAPLSEEAAGERPLLEQQKASRSRERRERTKQARDQTFAQIRALEIARQRDQAELAELRKQLNGFKPRFDEIQVNNVRQALSNLNAQLTQTNTEYQDAETRLFDALANQDQAAGKSMFVRRDDLALRRFQIQGQINQAQEWLRQNGQAAPSANGAGNGSAELGPQVRHREPEQRQQIQDEVAQPLPAQAQALAEDFAQEHPWFNPSGKDLDSRIVRAADESVA